jgi:hypothetical protein
MTDLVKQINVLEHEQIEIKHVNIISEIFIPLKKTIHNEMSIKNILIYYYNANMLKALDSLNRNDIESCNLCIN